MLSNKLGYVDDVQIVFAEYTSSVKTLEGDSELYLQTIIAAWRGKEIMFTCAAPQWIVGAESPVADEVRSHMTRILNGLQFDR